MSGNELLNIIRKYLQLPSILLSSVDILSQHLDENCYFSCCVDCIFVFVVVVAVVLGNNIISSFRHWLEDTAAPLWELYQQFLKLDTRLGSLPSLLGSHQIKLLITISSTRAPLSSPLDQWGDLRTQNAFCISFIILLPSDWYRPTGSIHRVPSISNINLFYF